MRENRTYGLMRGFGADYVPYSTLVVFSNEITPQQLSIVIVWFKAAPVQGIFNSKWSLFSIMKIHWVLAKGRYEIKWFDLS